MSNRFDATIDSLRKFECPEWFRDAKFGIWSHWGPQSVAMRGDWYARNIYIQGSAQYNHHCRVYGHPSNFGYKDIVKLWKAEKFDPEGLMKLFVDTGAKYFVAQAVHHDNFYNYNTELSEWNSVRMGPMQDICGLWKAAAKKYGLPFGISEHLAASYTWFAVSHGSDKYGKYAGVPYDGTDPANAGLYRDNDSELFESEATWYTSNEKYHKDWLAHVKDMIDRLEPDLLYSDGELPFGNYGLQAVAYLYNTSMLKNNGKNKAVYNFKQHIAKNISEGITEIGVLDVERGVLDCASEEPWQDDTSIGDWFYHSDAPYKTAENIIGTLVDITSKNGNLLLNVLQRPDGTIDDQVLYELEKIGDWMKHNGEGIFGTRPYKKAEEGGTNLSGGAFKENEATWHPTDYRFTKKDDSIYAFWMNGKGEHNAVIKSLGRIYENEVKEVSIHGKKAGFVQKDGALIVTVPELITDTLPVCIKIEMKS